jgi:hypothetical protein
VGKSVLRRAKGLKLARPYRSLRRSDFGPRSPTGLPRLCGGVPALSVSSCDIPHPTPATHELYEPLGCADWLGEGKKGGGGRERNDLLQGILVKVSLSRRRKEKGGREGTKGRHEMGCLSRGLRASLSPSISLS